VGTLPRDRSIQPSLTEAHERGDMVKPHVGRPESQPVVICLVSDMTRDRPGFIYHVAHPYGIPAT